MDMLIMLFESIDWGPDTIDTVLGLVPERYRANVEAVLALLATPTVIALLLAVWRAVMAKLAPKASGHPVVVALDRALDRLAVNSRRLESRAPVKERLSGAPPRQPTIRPPRGEP